MNMVAVVGAGVMGADVALTLSCYGYPVVLKDIRPDALQQARERICRDLRMVRMMKPVFKNLAAEEVMGRIRFALDYEGFERADIVIENVSETWTVKAGVYQELKGVCHGNVLVCVNTSCISITRIAALLDHPQNVIGMHFMNPVPLKEIVEVVKGYHTSPDTIDRAKAFLRCLEKTPVLVNDLPGFVANRLSHLFMNEAAFLIQDQVASAREVDLIFKKGYGHSMGPLETADLIGLDTVVSSLEVLYTSYQDPKFRCCPLLRKMVDAGLLGKKSGEGFFKYQDE
ncbi:MAG TPA: 3-hydroxyacyl-CoA dehydrogenase family protein [Puia sp.]|jgi:3-hydroxybutyryl-CoA dehydrogenase|nr:3-hydroxyacyl-CoA dehydrogenase family protein [Puia sp.]